FTVPWLVWQHAHRLPADAKVSPYYTDYSADYREVVREPKLLPRIIATNLYFLVVLFTPTTALSLDFEPSKGTVSAAFTLLGFLIGLALIVLGFLRRWRSGPRLPDVYLVFYLSLVIICPYTSYDRYLLPLLPFLLLYMITTIFQGIERLRISR